MKKELLFKAIDLNNCFNQQQKNLLESIFKKYY